MLKNYNALFYLFLLLSLGAFSESYCSTTDDLMSGLFAEGITVDLKEPTYTDGVLCTQKGGVIQGPQIRIQARSISYTRKLSDGKPSLNVVAEGDLLLEYGDYVIIGDRLEYDFQEKTGMVYNGRTGKEPWFFGGERIELLPDGSYILFNGYITTSENCENDWEISAEEAYIDDDDCLRARHVKLKFFQLPVLWLPFLDANLDAIFDSPFKYRVRWGGSQGPRVGIIYELIRWKYFKAFLRLDYRITRGPGGGLETVYRSADNKEYFLTSNYVSRDNSLEDPKEKIRYRFEGMYSNHMYDDHLNIDFSYDKLSDNQMETDYYERGLELLTAQRTQLLVRHQEDDLWISNFLVRGRINNFQTVKQELPSFTAFLHPMILGPTGVISENRFELSYLDFQYDHFLINVHNYDSSRFEFRNRTYRPFSIGPFINTPEIGVVGIHYGNSPERNPQLLGVFNAGYNINTTISRHYGNCIKHSIEPYASYNYYTFPTSSPREHFIFDIDDGWYRWNMARFGCRNLIYLKGDDCFVTRYLMADIWANAFFDTHTFPDTIPYVYSRLVWDGFSNVRNTLTHAWDIERNQTSFINWRVDYTINADCAFATEFRHRNDFAWRKVDHTNFMLESFHDEVALRASQLSDRRDTVLLHLFYRFLPNWAIECESRHGWHRRLEPSYNEYEIDLLTTFGTAWHVRTSYQHKMDDHRVALYINVGIKRPEMRDIYCE